jgi:heptosyltransferase-1
VEEEIEKRLQRKGITEFVILNPGAGWGAKQWPAARYGEVARHLYALGIRSVINFGPGEEPLAQESHTASGGLADIFLCSLSELIALTRRAQLFVGGDTGPMHLAAALGVPLVALFGPTDPARTGPYHCNSIVLRSPSSSTSHSHRQEQDEGLLAITPADVVTAAMQLLRRSRA